MDNKISDSTANPDLLIQIRDSIYAADLLVTAIARLDFFTVLSDNPSDLNTLCKRFKIQKRPADVMLTYFKSLGLIKEENGIYSTKEKSDTYLTSGSRLSLVPYYSTLKERPIVDKMLSVLQTGKPASWSGKKDGLSWENEMNKEEFAEKFTAGMDSRGNYFAPGLADNFDFTKYNSIIDVAGASGIYALRIKDKYPRLKAALFEKPPVDEIAKISLAKKGLANEIEIFSGDMFVDSLPKGFDIHLYSHVFHDWDFEENRRLVRNSYDSLNKNGIIMIHDAHLDEDKTGPLSVAEYSILLMFSTTGKCYSVGEMGELLETEGFTNIQFRPTIGNRSIITGKKQ